MPLRNSSSSPRLSSRPKEDKKSNYVLSANPSFSQLCSSSSIQVKKGYMSRLFEATESSQQRSKPQISQIRRSKIGGVRNSATQPFQLKPKQVDEKVAEKDQAGSNHKNSFELELKPSHYRLPKPDKKFIVLTESPERCYDSERKKIGETVESQPRVLSGSKRSEMASMLDSKSSIDE